MYLDGYVVGLCHASWLIPVIKIFHSSNGENLRDAHGRPIFLLATDLPRLTQSGARDAGSQEGNMDNTDNILNLLVDPVNGEIRHATSANSDFCGYQAEQIRKMNVAQLFLQPLEAIIEKISHSEYLKIISLRVCTASGETANAKVYASFMTIENQPMLFLCIFELAAAHTDPLPTDRGSQLAYA
jgi:hypothetical protein